MNQFIGSVGFGLVTASILTLAAVGFSLQFAVTNILNIAYGGVMIGCAFVAYFAMRAGLPVVLATVMATLAGGIGSVLLNRLVYSPFGRRGIGLFGMIIVSISVGLIFQNAMLAGLGSGFFSLPVGTGTTYRFGGFVLTSVQLIIIGVAAAAMIGIHTVLKHTMIGKAMRAIASDANLARTAGIRVRRVTDIAWLLSGLLCGLSGVVLALNTATFDTTTGSSFLVVVIAAAILGGIGQPYGAMAGAVLIGVGTEVAALATGPAYQQVVAFGVLVVVLLFRPQGIFAGVSGRREIAA